MTKSVTMAQSPTSVLLHINAGKNRKTALNKK